MVFVSAVIMVGYENGSIEILDWILGEREMRVKGEEGLVRDYGGRIYTILLLIVRSGEGKGS